MKGILFILCLLFISCSSQKSLITDPAVLQLHPKPIKIFGIGYWSSKYMVLTLTDADNKYFVITIQRNDSLRVGMFFVK